jgi:c-di-GMP phosphodiesterase
VPVSHVYLREEGRSVRVANGEDKPPVPDAVSEKWQRLIDLLSEIFATPASLVMQLKSTEIEVFLASRSEGNPYNVGAGDTLGHGLYCETVIGRREPLEVPDARQNESWRNNPDAKLDMVSYCGYPLAWPDGSIFGTICTLDSDERRYTDTVKRLMETFREVIELDLRQVLELHDLKTSNAEISRSLREMNHRLKNNLNNVLSYMQLKRSIDKVDLDRVFGEVEIRLRAISLIHEKLTGAGAHGLDTTTYLNELTDSALEALSQEPIQLDAKIDPVPLGSAILDIGIIVVELISNSVKYAFGASGGHSAPDERMLRIHLTATDGVCELTYTDFGPGVVEGTEPGLGTYIFESTAQKYDGTYSVEGDERNVFTFRFRIPTV